MKLSTASVIGSLEALKVSQKNLLDFLPKAITPQITPKEIGITPRVLHYWREKGLLKGYPILDERSDWIKLNLLEVIWLKIVQHLLNFGISTQHVREIGENLNLEVTDNLNTEDISKMIEESGLDENTKQFILAFLPIVKNNPSLINKDLIKVNTPIGSILSNILFYRGKINLIFYHKAGKIFFVIEGLKFSRPIEEELKTVKRNPHLVIPVNELIAEFLEKEVSEIPLNDFGLISEEEKKALEAIRNRTVREINIKKDDNNKITMTTSKQGKLTEQEIRQLIRMFGLNQYNEVRLVLRNNKNIFLEGKTKYKF